MVHKNGKLLWVNDNTLSFLGYQRESVIGTSVLDYLDEEYKKIVYEKMKTRESGKMTGDYEIKIRNKKNENRDVLVRASIVNYKNQKATLLVLSDISAQKLSESKINESEKKFRLMFENSAVGIAIVSPDGKWIKPNEELCKMLGYSEKELITHKYQDLTFSDDVKISQELIKKLNSGEKDKVFLEKRYLHKDGHIIWVNMSASIVKDSEGKPLYIVAITEDITEKKQNEDIIKKSDELVKNVNSILLRWIPDNKNISFINDYGSKIFGYKKDELINKNVEILVPPKESTGRDLSFLINDITIHPEKYELSENENVRKDGSRFWVSWANKAMRDEKGNLTEILAVGNDVTEKKKIEEKLIQNESFLRESQRIAQIGSYKTDFINDFWVSSEALDDIFGIDKNYKRSLDGWFNIFHPDDRKMMDKYLSEEVIKNQSRFDKEYRIVRISDRKIRWVRGLGEVKFDNKGNIVSMVGTIQDITDKKIFEEAKDTFLSLASHQLRTPLAAIKWVLESMQGEKESFSPKQQIKLRDLVVSNERLIKLVNYLLNVTRIEAGKLVINKEMIDLKKLVNDVSSAVKVLSFNKEIKIIAPAKLENVYCDPLLMGEAVGNLLSNAVAYSSENSKDIIIKIEDRKNDCLISVHNEGFIEEPTLSKIKKFDKFVRGEEAVKKEPSGSGLGLYITQKIVQLSGGTMWFESNAKSGTTFYFTITKN